MKENTKLSRRGFLKDSAIGAVGAMAIPAFLTACSKKETYNFNVVETPDIPDMAPDGKPLKVGLVGCGDRGTGAACDFLSAGNGVQIVALGDVFEEKLNASKAILKEKGQEIADENCFVGFDAYQKVIDSDIDVVLLCTPPVFRPVHFDYAIEKGKHCFIEKPCAVDPVGARAVLMTGKKAATKNLSVLSGTVRRSQRNCIATYRQVANGAIGDVVSAQVIRNGNGMWYKTRKPEWNDMEYMLKNWINFCWLSGDLVVEQFIHEIDLMSWFMGNKKPAKVVGTGGRIRRNSGDLYDNFTFQYIFDDGVRTNCSSRLVSGCDLEHSVIVFGTKGYTDCFGRIYNLDGTVKWEYEKGADMYPADDKSPFVLEHVRLIKAIRENKPVNDVESHVQSTMMAIMGRMAAYSGKIVTWDEAMASTLKLGPDTYEFGPVPNIPEVAPLPGIPNEEKA